MAANELELNLVYDKGNNIVLIFTEEKDFMKRCKKGKSPKIFMLL
jgi:hypothetical protein